MSGVFWCCCDAVPVVDECDCHCVCTYAWKFTEPYANIADPQSLHGALFTKEELVGSTKSEKFTINMWLNENCGQQGFGTHWHTYSERSTTSIRDWLWIAFDTSTGSEPFEIAVRVRVSAPGQGYYPLVEASIPMDDSTMPSNCKMMTVWYEQVDDGTGGKLAHLKIRLQWLQGVVVTRLEAESTGPDGEPSLDWGLEIPDEAQTYIGSYLPYCDDFAHTLPGGLLNDPLDGCMSNLTIYKEWLSEAQYEEKWNGFNGVIDDSAWEQWCPTQDFCFQDQIGSINGTRLQSLCPIKDDNGDLIEDGNNTCIFGTPHVPEV